MPRSSFHVALVAGALIASPRVLVGPANPAQLRSRSSRSSRSARWSASPEGAEVVDDDWRRFRARLMQREDALTEDTQGTMEKGSLMANERLAPWRKTGQRADHRHFDGLSTGCLFEFAGYDDRHRQQGRIVGCLTGAALESNIHGGRVFEGQVLAIEDGYYEYWFEDTYGKLSDSPVVFYHFCDVPVRSCQSGTAFRNPLHVDVFRLVTPSQVGRLSWLKDDQKAFIEAHPAVVGGRDPPGPGATPGPGDTQPPDAGVGAVQTGREGVEGLARALGGGPEVARPRKREASNSSEVRRRKRREKKQAEGRQISEGDDEEAQKDKKRKAQRAKVQEKATGSGGDLRQELSSKTPPEPRLSALELASGHKKKKKQDDKTKKKHASSSGSDDKRGRSPSSSSSSGELFHSAALPRGMERLRRVHQKMPGKLASLSLLRMQELVMQAQGRGTAVEQKEQLPAVATGYMASVFQPQQSQMAVGVRTLREMKTVAHTIDLLCLNDPLRALDVLVQRFKALELAHKQQSWVQAAQLELVLEDNQSAVFRPELKAAQTEVREDWKIQRGPTRPARPQAIDSAGLDDGAKKKFDELLKDGRLHQLYGGVLSCYESLDDKKQAYEDFTSLMVEWSDYSIEMILKLLENYYRPLASEGGLDGDSAFHRVAPHSRANQFGRRPARYQRAQEGKLLGVSGSTQVREIFTGWDALDGGVYVGDGCEQFPASIFRENYSDNIAVEDAARVLDGRPVYVEPGAYTTAAEVVEKFSISGKKMVWSWPVCQRFMAEQLHGEVSVSFVGVVLKQVMKRCPGHLGNFVRMLPACARRHFKQTPVELLPIALPEEGQAEQRLQRILVDDHGPRPCQSSEAALKAELAKECGADAWLGLILAVLNSMFCGSSRPLGRVMPHPRSWTPDQEAVVKHLKDMVRLWLDGEEAKLTVTNWEVQSQSLGDFYTGYEVTKAYRLTWEAIAPHVPGPGEAGRVSLSETVDPSLKDFVNDPSLLRIPDDELGEVRYSAPVLVESNAEYDLIVQHLTEAGMLEREDPDQTVRVKDTPVYNGMFGVHKGWIDKGQGQWTRSLRLIINLIPTNLLQRRMPQQPSKAMGYAPLWGSMVLLNDELILAYGEDIKHCFHVFAPGPQWRGYFVISKEASGSAFADGITQRGRPRVRSAPMGWANIVDFVQSSLERMGTMGGIPAARCVKMGAPSPLLELSTPRHFHSFYVDNFDSFTIIATTDLAQYEGKPSDSQLKLREAFQCWNIGRDEKKSAEGTLEWSSLGAEQLGKEGLVGSTRKFRRAVLSAVLNLLTKEDLRTNDLELLSVVGKLMHAVQYSRPLACCFDELYHNLKLDDGELLVDMGAFEELLMLSSLLPMMWTSQRSALNATVFATDASPEGGGACQTTGLSARGRSKLHLVCSEKDGMEGRSCDAILLIEVFGGMGGLRKAIEMIGVLPQGIILIDSDSICQKLAKRHCAYVLVVDNIHKVDKAMVSTWRAQFARCETVVVGGGWPCINHSSLNAERQGADAASSRLLDDMLELVKLLQQVSRPLRLPEWKIVEMYENVMMDERDLTTQSRKIGCLPLMCEAGDVLHCRRPRLFWLKNIELLRGSDLEVLEEQQVGELTTKLSVVKLTTRKPPLDWFLRKNCSKLVDDGRPFFTFARPIAKSEPPRNPAGYDRCDAKTLGRWRGDAYRLAPYQYSESNLVKTAQGPRRLLSDEQLRMLGYNSDALDLKQKLSEDQRGQLIGNTFPVLVVARLLAALGLKPEQVGDRDVTAFLWQVWHDAEQRVQQLKEASWSVRFGPGAGGAVGGLRHLLDVPGAPSPSPRSLLDPNEALTDEQLLVYMITRNVSHRGTDVNLDHGIPFSASDFCRRSVDPTHWEWKVTLSYKWKQPHAHITQLETIAVLDLWRKLCRSQSNFNKKTLLLVDNASVVGIVTKGRTSSYSLRQPLRRLAAVLVATSSRLIIAWVKSEWNPADGPSRQAISSWDLELELGPFLFRRAGWIHRSPLIEKGSVLLAKPGEWAVMFPFFHKSVILITDHEDEYTRGFVLNRPTPRSESYGRLEFNVWYGGPCEGGSSDPSSGLLGATAQRQFCLHSQPLPGSDLVAPGIYMTEPWAASRSIMEGKAEVDDFMLLVGHCMWGPGQLQAELDEGQTWEMAAMDTKAVLRFLPRQQRALRRRRCLSRGFPLWRRLYRRVTQKLVPEGNVIAREHVERLSDAELLRFVRDLDVSNTAPDTSELDSSSTALGEGNEQVQWQDTVRKVLYHMQQDLSASQQENCCEALRNLIVDQDSRSFASELGAIESVLKAMKAHSDAPGVQGHCAGTLTHLAAGLRERQRIFNANGLDVVVRGMQQHEDASLVQYKALEAFHRKAKTSKSKLQCLSHRGFMPDAPREGGPNFPNGSVPDIKVLNQYHVSHTVNDQRVMVDQQHYVQNNQVLVQTHDPSYTEMLEQTAEARHRLTLAETEAQANQRHEAVTDGLKEALKIREAQEVFQARMALKENEENIKSEAAQHVEAYQRILDANLRQSMATKDGEIAQLRKEAMERDRVQEERIKKLEELLMQQSLQNQKLQSLLDSQLSQPPPVQVAVEVVTETEEAEEDSALSATMLAGAVTNSLKGIPAVCNYECDTEFGCDYCIPKGIVAAPAESREMVEGSIDLQLDWIADTGAVTNSLKGISAVCNYECDTEFGCDYCIPQGIVAAPAESREMVEGSIDLQLDWIADT
eukprot:s2071_g1.t1